ncbi:TIGR03564 family F420-dependent LLM class oxidoreductase [Phytoactinopolyspora halotolerans]|uniref:TIGR03564 family F420-dependent LLM class oxidoreductase n=1 Tax=Phytoactinopolyspora halotolerans TaxID=1981512 RepID=A0A6L9SBI4_9ACTN|nr:TIGR03564 family F420-dependent LLM class oxidoreductase [Phytoactinopolyspora halotolerans]NEE02004.1 TIGR03564 family F420-dependent LLM class oxidoreductase [Phytoactinopolyspora halotolerans]
MRIGTWLDISGLSMPEITTAARSAGKTGYATLWFGEVGTWDPLTVLAVIAREVPEVRLGTAIVRTYPRHPLALAAQALTIQAASGGRLALGLGPSHAPIIEGQYGRPFTAPARNMREYLSALMPLLRGEPVDYRGEHWTAAGQLDLPGAQPPTVLVSALGPRMLELTGELADGVITTWAGPRALGERLLPSLLRAAERAGRASPEVVAQAPVCVTDDPDGVRARVSDELKAAGELPSYRAIFELQGMAGPGDTVIAGDEATVRRAIQRFADVGVTEFLATPVGSAEEKDRTLAVLAT